LPRTAGLAPSRRALLEMSSMYSIGVIPAIGSFGNWPMR
jgi:hypothetical protein